MQATHRDLMVARDEIRPVEPDFRAEVQAVSIRGETLTQFVEASVHACVERRRMQADSSRADCARETSCGVRVTTSMPTEHLQRKLDAEARGEEGQVTFKVRLTRGCEADLDRLVDLLLDRELSRDGGDLTLAAQAIAALRSGIATLIQDEGNVGLLAVRHRLEDDYH